MIDIVRQLRGQHWVFRESAHELRADDEGRQGALQLMEAAAEEIERLRAALKDAPKALEESAALMFEAADEIERLHAVQQPNAPLPMSALPTFARQIHDEARDMALEEAAKLIESEPEDPSHGMSGGLMLKAQRLTCRHLAEAIRALKSGGAAR